MSTKTVESIISPAAPHFVGDGFRVHNFIPGIPTLSMQRMDPVIMMDYNSKHHFAPSEIPRGVGVHPHRGFETVTIAYHGKIEHQDSSGGGGVIAEGDVQWMTAASGVLHKEFHEKEWSKKGGDFQMVQLWINLPAKEKMSPPKYQALENKNIPRYKLGGNSEIEIIAGEYNGMKGSASTFTPLHLLNVKLEKDAVAHFNFPKHYNTCLLIIKGAVILNDTEKLTENHFALMANDGESFTVKATDDAIVLLLSGAPINEPIASHGPFVMNTKSELVQAFEDYQNGKFGFLE
jgi:quercetin 2,3-dioxygenase